MGERGERMREVFSDDEMEVCEVKERVVEETLYM